MPETPRTDGELSPDESHLSETCRRAYERALDTAAESRRIFAINDPRCALKRDENGQPVYGTVPSWDEIQPSSEELQAIQRLEGPLCVISLPGKSLEDQAQTARELQPRIGFFGAHVETVNAVCWFPENPKKGETNGERVRKGVYTADGVDVLFIDGGDEVPNSTLGWDAYDMREVCKAQGVIQVDPDAYFALQLAGWHRGRPFDVRTRSWLDAYFKDSRTVGVGSWHRGSQWVYLDRDEAPQTSDPSLGGRRAVRLRKKT